jgi:hypothetical protein
MKDFWKKEKKLLTKSFFGGILTERFARDTKKQSETEP